MDHAIESIFTHYPKSILDKDKAYKELINSNLVSRSHAERLLHTDLEARRRSIIKSAHDAANKSRKMNKPVNIVLSPRERITQKSKNQKNPYRRRTNKSSPRLNKTQTQSLSADRDVVNKLIAYRNYGSIQSARRSTSDTLLLPPKQTVSPNLVNRTQHINAIGGGKSQSGTHKKSKKKLRKKNYLKKKK